MATIKRDLPSGYTQLEYIESTGTQYIDTGVKAVQKSKVLMDFMFFSGTALFGTYDSNKSFAFQYSNGKWYGYYGNSYGAGTTAVTNKRSTLNADGAKMYVDGVSAYSGNGSFSYSATSSTNMLLFGLYNSGTPNYFSNMRLYSCQIYGSTGLVRDYVPCKNSSNTIGLYDLINNTFSTNAGSGAFTAGPAITSEGKSRTYVGVKELPECGLPSGYTQVKYIESTGTQYINTGVSAPSGFRFVGTVAITNPDTTSTSCTIIGAYQNSTYNSITVYPNGNSGNSSWIIEGSKGSMTTNGSGHVFTTARYTPNVALQIDGATSSDEFRLKLNGINYEAYTSPTTSTRASNNIYIFGVNNQGSFARGISMKLGVCKIYVNKELVRDYVPCVSTSGAAGLYDLITKQFYGNSGTGSFIAGSSSNNSVARRVNSVFVGIPCETPTLPTLPSGYTALEYIESNGNEYINTDIKGNYNTKIVFKASADSNRFNISDNNGIRLELFNDTSGNRGVVCYPFYSYNPVNYNFTDIYPVEIEYGATGLKINNVQITSFSYSYEGSSTIKLFKSSTTTSNVGGRCYYCKIYSGSSLVRDLVPCKNSAGAIGMYDLVNNKFYTNAGAGSFNTSTQATTSVAHKVLKAYIGVGSVARPCGIAGITGQLACYGPIGKTSYPVWGHGAATIGNYAIFAGGTSEDEYGPWNPYQVYAISNSLVQTTAAEMYTRRSNMASTTLGDYAVFHGGNQYDYAPEGTIDYYNSSLTHTYNPYYRSNVSNYCRASHMAGRIGNYALFAGGYNDSWNTSKSVEVINTSLTYSSTTDLVDEQCVGSSVTIGGHVIFAGGTGGSNNIWNSRTPTAYDESLTRIRVSSTFSLQVASVNYPPAFIMQNKGVFCIGRYINTYDTSLTLSTFVVSSLGSDRGCATLGEYAIIAGYSSPTLKVDSSLTFTPTTYQQSNRLFKATTVGNYALFAGDINNSDSNIYAYTII